MRSIQILIVLMCKCLIKNTRFGKVQVFQEDHNNLTKFPIWLSYPVNVKSTGRFCQIFVAFFYKTWTLAVIFACSTIQLLFFKKVIMLLPLSNLCSFGCAVFENYQLFYFPTMCDILKYLPIMYLNCLKNIKDIFEWSKGR